MTEVHVILAEDWDGKYFCKIMAIFFSLEAARNKIDLLNAQEQKDRESTKNRSAIRYTLWTCNTQD